MASIAAPTLACARVTPLPHVTDTLARTADGRTHEKTGIPRWSRPVMSATRVIPDSFMARWIRCHVAFGAIYRWTQAPLTFVRLRRRGASVTDGGLTSALPRARRHT